mgnify:CR=1 FL=1
MGETRERERAREVARTRYGLRWHLPVYVLVNAGLVLVWWISGGGFFWPAFPILGWGIGVVLHYLSAYRSGGNAWVDRETERVLQEFEQTDGTTNS